MLMAFHFLTGFFGSPILATGGTTVVDLYTPKKRVYGMTVWGVFAASAPSLGPLLRSFSARFEGWRWTIWELMWLSGATLVLLFFFPETSVSNILYRRARHLRKATGNNSSSNNDNASRSADINHGRIRIRNKAVSTTSNIKPVLEFVQDNRVDPDDTSPHPTDNPPAILQDSSKSTDKAQRFSLEHQEHPLDFDLSRASTSDITHTLPASRLDSGSNSNITVDADNNNNNSPNDAASFVSTACSLDTNNTDAANGRSNNSNSDSSSNNNNTTSILNTARTFISKRLDDFDNSSSNTNTVNNSSSSSSSSSNINTIPPITSTPAHNDKPNPERVHIDTSSRLRPFATPQPVEPEDPHQATSTRPAPLTPKTQLAQNLDAPNRHTTIPQIETKSTRPTSQVFKALVGPSQRPS